GPYGVYHSIYDDLFWMEHFGDPEFLYHTAASRLYGLLAMRLGAADIVPLRYGAYGRALSRELELLRREAVRERRVWEAARTWPPLVPAHTLRPRPDDRLRLVALPGDRAGSQGSRCRRAASPDPRGGGEDRRGDTERRRGPGDRDGDWREITAEIFLLSRWALRGIGWLSRFAPRFVHPPCPVRNIR